jgi:hypothetical protein
MDPQQAGPVKLCHSAPDPQPSLQIEKKPPRPSQAAVWVSGYWHRHGTRWFWVPGEWVESDRHEESPTAPRPQATPTPEPTPNIDVSSWHHELTLRAEFTTPLYAP